MLGCLQVFQGHVLEIVAVHRSNEAVATLRHIDDVALAVLTVTERPAQGGNVDAKIDLFDHRSGPDPCNQLFLSDHSACTLDQHLQNVQRTPAHAQLPIPVEDQPLAQMKGVRAEIQD